LTPTQQADRLRILTRLESLVTLSDEERAAVLRLPVQTMDLPTDHEIASEGDTPSRCVALLDGLACSYKVTADGSRQIIAFHVPGDIPDLQGLQIGTMDNGLATLTPCRVGVIPHEALREVCHAHPRIADALWRETLKDAARFREWMVSVGRRKAFGRTAHLLCELVVRLRAVGLAKGDGCELPITQIELGDALGMSAVHVNRTLKELRSAGLVTHQHRTLVVHDWAALVEAGDFDPAYLHLPPPPVR
jgi:CRP-like cAMP-binding protein